MRRQRGLFIPSWPPMDHLQILDAALHSWLWPALSIWSARCLQSMSSGGDPVRGWLPLAPCGMVRLGCKNGADEADLDASESLRQTGAL